MERDLDALPLEPERPERAPAEPQRSPDREPDSRTSNERDVAIYRTRGNAYRLSSRQLDVMNDVGRFRTVEIRDLERHRCHGSQSDASGELQDLTRQGVVQIKSVRSSASGPVLRVAVLTRIGRQILSEHGLRQPTQALYAGLVKAREVAHDAAIYRMFQAERERIEQAGGQLHRVVLDYELKQKVYAPLAKFRSQRPGASAVEYARRQAEVAHEHGLKVVQGRIPLPDLRIEYVNAQGESARVDLELATHHYHGRAMEMKAAAGFTFYADSGAAGHLAKVLEERDITVAILSL